MISVQSGKGDHYWALQLKKNASPEDIELAYRYLKGSYQSKVDKGLTHYSELLAWVEEAYAVLSDPEKRKVFDDTYQSPKTVAGEVRDIKELLEGSSLRCNA